MAPLAAALGLSSWLQPLHALLERGNQAMRWQDAHAAGAAVATLIAEGATAMEQQEAALTAGLATDHPLPLG